MVYRTKGTCSQQIHVEAENGVITSVEFIGGCAYPSARRNHLWQTPYLLPGPVSQSAKTTKKQSCINAK